MTVVTVERFDLKDVVLVLLPLGERLVRAHDLSVRAWLDRRSGLRRGARAGQAAGSKCEAAGAQQTSGVAADREDRGGKRGID